MSWSRMRKKLGLNDVVARRVANEFSDGMEIQSMQDVGAMGLHHLDTEM